MEYSASSVDSTILMRIFCYLFMQCDELVEHGASIGESPAAVIKKCKYTIGMLSDPSAALSVSDCDYYVMCNFCTCTQSSSMVVIRWSLTKMVFLSKLVVERVTLTCQQLTLILLPRYLRLATKHSLILLKLIPFQLSIA